MGRLWVYPALKSTFAGHLARANRQLRREPWVALAVSVVMPRKESTRSSGVVEQEKPYLAPRRPPAIRN